MKHRILAGALLLLSVASASAQTRPLKPEDLYKIPALGAPDISPDGKWVAYSISRIDTAKDRSSSDLFMVSWDGRQTLQLTSSPDGESQPKFSPDNQYIAFTSSRLPATSNQIWLLNRAGGEATKLTDLKGSLRSFEWSPDGKKMLLEIQDPAPAGKTPTTPKPIVIDRYKFKQDVQGYLQQPRPAHLYLFDIATKKLDTLTRGKFDESGATWSPDGKHIAFVSNRTDEPDRNANTDIFILEARKGAEPKQLTTWTGRDGGPEFSPDGSTIAYLRSTSSEPYFMYDQSVLCTLPVAGGEPKLLTLALDRPVSNPAWTKDAKSIYFVLSDDRERSVASIDLGSGKINKVFAGERSFQSIRQNPANNEWLVQLSTSQHPSELFTAAGKELRRLTTYQDEWSKGIALAKVEGFRSKSKDGTAVSGILYRPATVAAGEKLPLLVFIHGGPVSQDEFSFDQSRQVLAAAGYAVAAINYRGSSGRGIAFSKSISGDWGNKEVIDIHGAIDYLVEQGIADGQRLGVGGWSYGGILTDYLIATDNRFKAAASGAGTAFPLGLYGVDQYIMQYDNEIGTPWTNLDKYLKISYPFLHADRIKTPTMFMSGEKDFNVPTAGSEQMYQALRSQNVPAQLIIYPGQFHGISVPSYQVDRLNRYIAWFDKYVK